MKKGKEKSIGCFVWLAILVIIILLFYVDWNPYAVVEKKPMPTPTLSAMDLLLTPLPTPYLPNYSFSDFLTTTPSPTPTIKGANNSQIVQKRYSITYTTKILQNNSVGNEWYYGVLCNDETLSWQDEVIISLPSNSGLTLTIYVGERDDARDDYGEMELNFSNIDIGDEETIVAEIVVREDAGRYTGNRATIEFTVTVTRTR